MSFRSPLEVCLFSNGRQEGDQSGWEGICRRTGKTWGGNHYQDMRKNPIFNKRKMLANITFIEAFITGFSISRCCQLDEFSPSPIMRKRGAFCLLLLPVLMTQAVYGQRKKGPKPNTLARKSDFRGKNRGLFKSFTFSL